MCQRPNKLITGVLVACRKCWQCRENKINDWVGRCIAEKETVPAANAITLTYGRDENGQVDHLRAAVLTYSDVQKYFKLIRRHGYPCRYFAVGEYGSEKGRAHWHVVVFWTGTETVQTVGPDGKKREVIRALVPRFKEKSKDFAGNEYGKGEEYPRCIKFNERHWPHGFSEWDDPTAPSIRYICKYIQKDIGLAERQGHLSMSKKPPLGAKYFEQLAGRYVKQGVAPLEPYYWFPEVRDDQGKPIKFYMQGVSLDNFCRTFLEQWEAVHGTHAPHSAMIEDYCDRMAEGDNEVRLEPFRPRHASPWVAAPNGETVSFSEQLNSYFYDATEGRFYWSFDDEGNRSWERKIRTEREVESTRRLKEYNDWEAIARYGTFRDGGD